MKANSCKFRHRFLALQNLSLTMRRRHSLVLLWIPFFLFIFTNNNLIFSLPFLPSENVTLFGEATYTDYAISLTNEELTCLPSSSGTGRAFFAYPVRFLDPTTNSTASFSCRFSFSIIASSSCPSPGDGIAFLISSSTEFSTLSGYMGLPAPQQDSYFAVEFDTSFDPSLGDINGNHVGIDVSNVVSFASVDALSRGIDLKSGKLITAWIEYRDAMKMVRVWVGYSSSTRPSSPILASQIDLTEKFNEFMHVGFSASHGQGSGVHLVHNWQFKTLAYSHSVSPIDMVGESDCFLCYTGDSDSSLNRRKKIGEIALGLGGITALVMSVLTAAVVVCVYLRKRKGCGGVSVSQSCRFQNNKVPMRLSLSEIKSATLGFNRDRLVGEGASAKVYKGSLPFGGGDVAVKRFDRDVDGLDCLHNPFATEFATMVGCLRHKNLVQLKGWCCEGSELVLVYEYLPNGSLNKVLHRNFNSSIVLAWQQRVNIVLGVASALTYLHEECERQIIHRDVKTCNIMLDADFTAKLGDFGLAEVYEHSSSTRDATIPAGTMGYLAPEYVYSGVPTVKTDVYSFGVVMIEVATGRKPVEDDGTVVADYVWNLWERNRLIEAADPRLMGRFDALEMEMMLLVGLLCVHPDFDKRPRVRDAARMLKKEAPIPLLPPSKPRVRIRPICLSDDTPETQDVVGDWLSTDEAPYLTPRSRFY